MTVNLNVAPSALRAMDYVHGVRIVGLCDFFDAIGLDWRGSDWETESQAVRAYCAQHGVAYYGAPSESYSDFSAARRAKEIGASTVICENLS